MVVVAFVFFFFSPVEAERTHLNEIDGGSELVKMEGMIVFIFFLRRFQKASSSEI